MLNFILDIYVNISIKAGGFLHLRNSEFTKYAYLLS